MPCKQDQHCNVKVYLVVSLTDRVKACALQIASGTLFHLVKACDCEPLAATEYIDCFGRSHSFTYTKKVYGFLPKQDIPRVLEGREKMRVVPVKDGVRVAPNLGLAGLRRLARESQSFNIPVAEPTKRQRTIALGDYCLDNGIDEDHDSDKENRDPNCTCIHCKPHKKQLKRDALKPQKLFDCCVFGNCNKHIKKTSGCAINCDCLMCVCDNWNKP